MTLLGNKTILIVDDIPENIDVLSALLGDQYRIKAATNGKKAIKIANTEPKPDLILLDVMMPGMDGYEVCQQLKAEETSKRIPVIFVTALYDTEDEEKGLALGAIDYITKPISPAIVKARVKNHLLLKEQTDALQKSITMLEHEAEISQQKADLGLQAGGLAHDILNILSSAMLVEMITELLPEKYPDKQTVDEYIKLTHESLLLGEEVCRGFTSYLQEIGSEAMVQEVLPLLQPIDIYSRKFKGTIIKDFSDDLPQINCRGFQIKRVLVNLFTNAYQALDGQKDKEIIIKTWSENEQVFIAVKDNGPGIPKDILEDIFKERFTTKKTGTGLGLFMVKEIIDNHNGTISVNTTKWNGSTFTICFPTAKG